MDRKDRVRVTRSGMSMMARASRGASWQIEEQAGKQDIAGVKEQLGVKKLNPFH